MQLPAIGAVGRVPAGGGSEPEAVRGGPVVGLGSRAHARLVSGAPNASLALQPPTQGFVQDTTLLNSPALLADYAAWVRDFDAVTERGTATRAYRELTIALYEHALNPRQDERYWTDLNAKLATFRQHFGDSGVTLPAEVRDAAGVLRLGDALVDRRMVELMRDRYGVNVHPVTYLNSPRDFDLLMSRRDAQSERTARLWDMQPHAVRTTFATPVQRGVDAYRAGIAMSTFPGLFAMGREGVVIDDWLLRDRAMAFAHAWKRSLDGSAGDPLTHPIADAVDLQYRMLRDESRAELDAAYDRLLPLVAGEPQVRARFARERAAGDYPAEVYQHVAYANLRAMLQLQGDFYVSALAERPETSQRQLGLQSLLTLQRYTPAWRYFMTELSTQSQPLFARAAVIDQVADPVLAFTYVAEQLKAILGSEVYAQDDLYDRMRYAILADELFEPRYLREYQPAIHQELLQPDGSLRRVSEMPRADQIRLLRQYMTNPNGTTSATGIVRMRSVLTSRVREDDVRRLAEVIYSRRAEVAQR